MELKSAFLAPSAANPAGTAGVDMAANPLSLGVRKLRASVNMRHEEGTLKTRFGFRYHRLGVSGQFQGAFHYTPSKGLSSRPFAPKNSALVVAVRGRLFLLEATGGDLSCGVRELCGDYDFECKGAVNIYQAENWLVVQNRESNTWFWEGFNCLTRSPGMAGDLDDTDPALPTPVLPRTGRCWTTNTFLRFSVVDDVTGLPIPGASVVLKVGDRQDYGAATGANGETTFFPVPKTYTYYVTKEGYLPVGPVSVVIRPNGTLFIRVEMHPVAASFIGISITLQYLSIDDPCESGHICNSAIFDIFANGIFVGNANLNNQIDGGTRSASFDFTPEQAEDIAAGSPDGHTIQFSFECDTDHPDFDPIAWSGGCHPNIGQFIVTDVNDAELYNGCPIGTTVDIDVNPAP